MAHSSFNGGDLHRQGPVSAPQGTANKAVSNGRARIDDGPWPDPGRIDREILGVIGSIQSHMRKGVPLH